MLVIDFNLAHVCSRVHSKAARIIPKYCAKDITHFTRCCKISFFPFHLGSQSLHERSKKTREVVNLFPAFPMQGSNTKIKGVYHEGVFILHCDVQIYEVCQKAVACRIYLKPSILSKSAARTGAVLVLAVKLSQAGEGDCSTTDSCPEEQPQRLQQLHGSSS